MFIYTTDMSKLEFRTQKYIASSIIFYAKTELNQLEINCDI